MMKNKKIVPVIALIVMVIAIIGIAFQANFLQIGDCVVSDTYYDTAYEAYKNSDVAVNIEEEITTVNINNKFAVWFAESDEDELVLIKMAVKDGKYFSLGDVSIYNKNTLNHNTTSLDDEFSLGNNILKFSILPKEKYENSAFGKEKYNAEYFIFNNTDYVFVYEVVSD